MSYEEDMRVWEKAVRAEREVSLRLGRAGLLGLQVLPPGVRRSGPYRLFLNLEHPGKLPPKDTIMGIMAAHRAVERAHEAAKETL